MQMLRRLIAWSCFLGLLALFGGGVFHFIPIRPLCTFQGDFRFAHFTGDGRWVLTQKTLHEEPDELRIWNAHSGRLERTFETLRSITLLPDSRHFLQHDPDDRMHFVDLRNGTAWTPDFKWGLWDYMATGRWRTVYEVPDDDITLAKFHLFDAHQHRLVRRMNLWPYELTKDDRFIIGRNEKGSISVERPETGQQVVAIPIKFPGSETSNTSALWNSSIRLTPDGRWLIHALEVTSGVWLDVHFEGGDPHLFCRHAKGFEVWELATGKRHSQFASAKAELRSVLLSPDGSVFATWPTNSEKGVVEIFETATGRKLGALPVERSWRAEFSTDAERLLFHYPDDHKIVMIDVASGRIVWDAASTELARFIDSATVVLHADESAPLVILDAQSGRVKHRIPWTSYSDFVFTPDRSWCAFSGVPWAGRKLAFWERWLEKWRQEWDDDASTTVCVADLKKGRVRFRVQLPQVDRFQLSDDGSTLVTIDRDSSPVSGTNGGLIEVWDVGRNRTRIWAWSASLALGVVMLLLRRWRLKRKTALRSNAAGHQQPHAGAPIPT